MHGGVDGGPEVKHAFQVVFVVPVEVIQHQVTRGKSLYDFYHVRVQGGMENLTRYVHKVPVRIYTKSMLVVC